MRIKVFKADDMNKALAMVKAEMGSDAVILHTKRHKKSGFLGFGKGKETVEVTAAVEDDVNAAAVAPKPAAAPEPRINIRTVPPKNILAQYRTAGTEAGVAQSAELAARLSAAGADFEEEIPVAAQPARPPVAPPVAPPPEPEPPVEAAFQPIQPDAVSMPDEPSSVPEKKEHKSRVIKAAASAPLLPVEPEPLQPEPEPLPPEPAQPVQPEPVPQEAARPEPEAVEPARTDPMEQATQDKIAALEAQVVNLQNYIQKVTAGEDAEPNLLYTLRNHEIGQGVIDDMRVRLARGTFELAKSDPMVEEELVRYFRNMKYEPGRIMLKDGKSRIVALIGTTGVGKTTTLAKIAAKFVLERGVGVALITADTYRISAVEQLKTYSDIIGLPLEIVYTPTELKSAIRKFRNKELVLIDTAGRSQRNDFQMKELAELLSADRSIEKHLVLSATTKERDAEDIIERFSVVNPDRILFTKTDETRSVGLIINMLYRRRLRISYLTNGQSVPDDIESVSPEALARLILA